MSIFDCCKRNKKYVIYVSGSNANKEQLLKDAFSLPMKDLSFAEYKVTVKNTEVYLQVVKDEEILSDIDEMHSKMANAIILLKDKDEKVKASKKPTLVLVTGNTIHESEGNVIVKSVNNNDFSNIKSSIEELVNFI